MTHLRCAILRDLALQSGPKREKVRFPMAV